jgi:diguanylate cyclase (GGDEF)-like protein
VLVVGGGPASRRAVAAALGADHELLAARDAAAAASLARAERLDALVLDLPRPALGALAALGRLRQEPATAHLPAVVLSAERGEAARLRALELGADFVAVPCSAGELRVRLARAMQLARSARALRDEALTDALTGLPNRRALEERLAEEVSRARRYRTSLACVMADLDRLKPINDAHGHAAGDRALVGMAAVLRAQLRESDFAARAGGDEFVVLLPHTSAQEARALAARVHRGLRAVRAGAGRRAPPVSASFGVASLGGGADGAALVAAADAALYAAKRAGRSTVRVAPAAGAGAATPSPRRPRPRRRARRRGCAPRRRSG